MTTFGSSLSVEVTRSFTVFIAHNLHIRVNAQYLRQRTSLTNWQSVYQLREGVHKLDRKWGWRSDCVCSRWLFPVDISPVVATNINEVQLQLFLPFDAAFLIQSVLISLITASKGGTNSKAFKASSAGQDQKPTLLRRGASERSGNTSKTIGSISGTHWWQLQVCSVKITPQCSFGFTGSER